MNPQTPPPGYHTATPYLIVNDAAAAIEFYAQAFGATERFRLPMPDGSVAHAEIQIGNSIIMLSDECKESGSLSPKTVGHTTGSTMLYLDEVDAVFAKAIEAGAQELSAVADQFWGDRMGSLVDPFGHRWSIATQVEVVPEEEIAKRMEAFTKQMSEGQS